MIFFCSVFTKEDTTNLPSPEACHKRARLDNIEVDPDTIANKLTEVRPDKAAGSNNMSPRLLKNISNEIANPVAYVGSRGVTHLFHNYFSYSGSP